MKQLIYCSLIAFVGLAASCQKETIPVVQDARDALVGTYTGTTTVENKAEDSNGQESTTVDDFLAQQSIVISKSATQENGLIINGDESNILLLFSNNQNEYSDLSLYSADDCNGIKSYQLEFLTKENKLIYHYKHRHDCAFGSLQQKSTFEGIKVKKD